MNLVALGITNGEDVNQSVVTWSTMLLVIVVCAGIGVCFILCCSIVFMVDSMDELWHIYKEHGRDIW